MGEAAGGSVVVRVGPVVTPLAGLIGAEVDVDLRDIDDEVFGCIREAFLEYVILVFPGQQLSPDDQLAFARLFGDLYRYPHGPGMKGHEMVLPINLPSGVRRGRWHSDATFDERRPSRSCPPVSCRAGAAKRRSPTSTRRSMRCPTA